MGCKLFIVRADDWEGLFKDGSLVEEGHSIQIDDLGKHVPIDDIKTQEASPALYAYLGTHGSFDSKWTLEQTLAYQGPAA